MACTVFIVLRFVFGTIATSEIHSHGRKRLRFGESYKTGFCRGSLFSVGSWSSATKRFDHNRRHSKLPYHEFNASTSLPAYRDCISQRLCDGTITRNQRRADGEWIYQRWSCQKILKPNQSQASDFPGGGPFFSGVPHFTPPPGG
jgi:hypothetical protein